MSDQKKIAMQARFLICDDCSWCASYLDTRLAAECPACGGTAIEDMPVFANERYTFDYNPRDGVVLGFAPLPAQTT